MNKIFKIVWSKARQCYVVVSEFGRNNTKSGRMSKVALAAIGAIMMAGSKKDKADAKGENV